MNYKLLGRSGLRVSELCLGTMTFGTEWNTGADKQQSKEIFESFVQSGGNFLDTANRYTEGTSEKFLGEFIANDRDYFVLASKYSLQIREHDLNASGNHKKNMVTSVEHSLKRLQTDYLDVYWVHAWDFTTPEEEVMRGLDDLVRSGKVLHIGISDTPAWVIAKSNTLAELRGWNQFVALQIEYSLITRDAERDLLPMAKAFGLTVTPWSPLGSGMLTGKYLANKDLSGVRLKAESARLSDRNMRIATTVAEIAEIFGISAAQVALAWIRQKHPSFIPIIGARTQAQLSDNIASLNITIPEEYIQKLDDVSAIQLGFPHDFLASENIQNILFSFSANTLQR